MSTAPFSSQQILPSDTRAKSSWMETGLPTPPRSSSSLNDQDQDQDHNQDDPWSGSTSAQKYKLHTMDLGVGGGSSSLEASWRSSQPGNGNKDGLLWDTRSSNSINGLGIITDEYSLQPINVDEKKSVGAGKGKQVQRQNENQNQNEPMGIHVLALMMDSSKGRDKILKCAQYSLRTYLYVLTLIARIRPLSRWFQSNQKRVKLAVSGLSLTRKCLLLLNPLHPLTSLLSPEPTSARTLVSHLVDFVSAISDDIYCLSKLGLVSRRIGGIADRWSNRFWLMTTLISLYKLHSNTLPNLRSTFTLANSDSDSGRIGINKKLSEAEWSNRKLLSDLSFVSYDVLDLNIPFYEEPMKCITGLISGLISASKLYDQQWEASVGKG